MIRYRHAEDRGHLDHGWLDTWHSFSFADYHDPRHMGFRALRVINEDRVQGGQGFGTHPHRDMEIVTIVLSGALEHRDSMGNGSVIRPGELQRMSAGTGVLHSEVNPSPDEVCHLLQIWLLPRERGIEPGYEQRTFPDAELADGLRLVAAPDGRDGALTIHSDAELSMALLGSGEELTHPIAPNRHVWMHVATGRVAVQEQGGTVTELGPGGAAALSGEDALALRALEDARVLVFDLV